MASNGAQAGDGDDPAGESPAGAGTPVPKLTIGQRLLTALPQLRKEPTEPAPAAGTDELDDDGAVEDHDGEPVLGEAAEDDTADDDTAGGTAPTRAAPRARPVASGRSGSRSTASRDVKRPHKDVPSADLVHRIKYIDDREQRYIYIAAVLGVALLAVEVVDTLRTNPAIHQKNHVAPSQILIEGAAGLVFAVAAVVAARFRRRSFVIFSLAFLGYCGGLFTLIPMWALAGWLFFGSNKYQRELTMRGENPRQRRNRAASSGRSASSGGGAAARNGSARGAAARGAAAANARSARRGKRPEPAGPTPNKRYTPPKPPRPKIPKE